MIFSTNSIATNVYENKFSLTNKILDLMEYTEVSEGGEEIVPLLLLFVEFVLNRFHTI